MRSERKLQKGRKIRKWDREQEIQVKGWLKLEGMHRVSLSNVYCHGKAVRKVDSVGWKYNMQVVTELWAFQMYLSYIDLW